MQPHDNSCQSLCTFGVFVKTAAGGTTRPFSTQTYFGLIIQISIIAEGTTHAGGSVNGSGFRNRRVKAVL